jgi:hypothetical protein
MSSEYARHARGGHVQSCCSLKRWDSHGLHLDRVLRSKRERLSDGRGKSWEVVTEQAERTGGKNRTAATGGKMFGGEGKLMELKIKDFKVECSEDVEELKLKS